MKAKKLFPVFGLLLASLMMSCSQHHSHGNSSLTVSESEHEYKIQASYPESNTTRVEQYMNEKIGARNKFSFVHATLDADLSLDDGTQLYIKNTPGELKIRFDKDKNSHASYQEVKALGDGLKAFLNE